MATKSDTANWPGGTVLELTPPQAIEFWPEVLPFVQQALDYDVYNTVDLADLKLQLQKGYARVLIATAGGDLYSATVIQLFMTAKSRRVLHVLTTAGNDSRLWLPVLLEKLQQIGGEEKCEAITMSGRPGWAKKLNALGFRVSHVNMEIKVNERIGRSEQIGTTEPAAAAVTRP